jgi:hypothetical protein
MVTNVSEKPTSFSSVCHSQSCGSTFAKESPSVYFCISSTILQDHRGICCSPEMQVTTYKNTWHQNPNDHSPHFHQCEKFKSQKADSCFTKVPKKLVITFSLLQKTYIRYSHLSHVLFQEVSTENWDAFMTDKLFSSLRIEGVMSQTA